MSEGEEMSLKDLISKSYYYDKDGVLLHGDCLEVMKEIPDRSVDLIVTDPPYKTTARGGTILAGMCAEKIFRDGKVFKHNDINFKQYLPELFRILKKDSNCYIMINNVNLIELLNEVKDAGFHFIKCIIWDKIKKIPCQTYMNQFEYILFLRKGGHRKINNCGTTDILNIPSNKTKNKEGKLIHPTEKPVELMKVLIGNSSQENDIVYDPFGGVGSVGLACKELKRKFILSELDENYCAISKNRLSSVE